MKKLIDLSATEMAQGIKNKKFTSQELIQAHLNQISKHNAKVNALITPFENALTKAKEADQALENGEDWGPLHGVPVTVKDSWATAGVRTTSSFKPLRKHIPEQDAVVVKNLLDAGAIILGKTNLPMMASDIQSNSPIFGRTHNPWDVSRTPGGSTGGGAAAVSARFSPIEIGSDLAGSIRIPAHFCGIMGFKPTEGVLSLEGHIPPAPGKPGVKHQAHAGVLARTVEDIKLSYECVGGTKELVDLKKLSDYKVAWLSNFDHAPLSEDTDNLFQGFLKSLGKELTSLSKDQPEGINYQEIWETFGYLFGYESGKSMPWLIRFIYKQSFKKLAYSMYKGVYNGLGQNYKNYQDFLHKRTKAIQLFTDFFKKYDVWICPVVSRQAFPHIKTGKDIAVDGKATPYWIAAASYTTIFNVTGMPSISIPIGYASDGLPIGVQLVAGLGKDQQLLAFAAEVEKLLPKVGMPKGFE